MGKLVKLVTTPPSEECYFRIDGDPPGYGPFSTSWKGVSAQMIIVMRAAMAQLEEELYDIVQEEE